MKKILGALVASAMLASGAAKAAELEVVHWWTSGGEAAAVNEFAKAFDAAGHKWVDGAIAGGGGTNAIPAVVSACWAATRWAPHSSTMVVRPKT